MTPKSTPGLNFRPRYRFRKLKNKRVDQAYFWAKNSTNQIIAHSKEFVELFRMTSKSTRYRRN